jgi:hypothetical protein
VAQPLISICSTDPIGAQSCAVFAKGGNHERLQRCGPGLLGKHRISAQNMSATILDPP